MKSFSCGDVVPGCQATFVATDEEEIMAKVAAHAAADHGMDDVDDATAAAVRAEIRETA